MIPLITYICLTWMPVEDITSQTPWHEQRIELIESEPTLEDLEWQIREREIMDSFNRVEADDANRR